MKWELYTADVTSAFRGVTAPAKDLYDEIHGRGWDVSSVKVKDGQYVATCKNPHGEQVEKTGPTPETALSNALIALTRIETMRYRGRTAAWQSEWSDNLPEIAQAYAEAPVYDPKAASAWKELAEDCKSRANQIAQQVQVEFTHDPHPYKDVNEMVEDLTNKKHIYVTTANADHPVWSLDQVLAYRLVHDVLGHAQAGGDWGWHGENRATAAHMPLLSPNAQKALFTEAIGQTAHNQFYRNFGPTKVVFLEDHLKDAQDAENAPGHAGIHPSQTTVPGMVPEIPGVHESSFDGDHLDPNYGWESGVNPLPDNAYLWQREKTGLDPLDHQGLKDHAHRLNTGWFNLARADGSPDTDSQRQAVVNAFRAVLLNPRKPYRWNAAHYQHIHHIPATVDDPMRYHDALEGQRDAYNQARGLPAGLNRQPFSVEANALRSWVKATHPQLDDGQAAEIAKRELFHMMAEEEERIAADDANGELSAAEISTEVAQALKKRLAVMLKGNIDQKFDFGRDRLFHESTQPMVYGDHLVTHLKPIAGVSHHANDILKAAREDVANHGGKGHHFRGSLMHLIPGVGPKELSYAWMLLQPHTSELGVIDPILAEKALDHKGDPSNRDYFKLERQLAAGRDAAGYSHVPLGQFGWGLWDNIAYGHGVHRDHQALRPVDPAPHEQIDWSNLPDAPSTSWNSPYWWKSTQEPRDQVGRHYDEAIGINTPREEIPYRTASASNPFETLWNQKKPIFPGHAEKLARRARVYMSKDEAKQFIEDHSDDFKFEKARRLFEERFFKAWGRYSSNESRTPWFIHEGEQYEGQPGHSIMQHARNSLGLSTEEIWRLIEEAGKQ